MGNNARIKQVVELTHDVKEFTLIAADEFNFVPGQFVTIKIDDGLPATCYRAYSVADYNSETLEFKMIVKIVEGGRGSGYLNKLKEGDKVEFVGPSGKFFIQERETPIIMMCTGTGIVPFLSFLNILKNSKRTVRLFWGLRHEKDIYYEDLLKKYKETFSDFDYYISLTKPENDTYDGLKGRITDHLDLFSEYNGGDYYLCGNGEMIDQIKQLLGDMGIDRIFYEKF